jgi:hypothetical protein
MSDDKILLPCGCEGIPVSELDDGIRNEVTILRGHGIETYESCQGGKGHAYPVPTIRFNGDDGEGFRALSIAISYGLCPDELRRGWSILYGNQPEGPYWEMTFSKDVEHGTAEQKATKKTQ